MSGTEITSLLPVSDAQAHAVTSLANLGQTIVEEGGQLTRYIGRVIGTIPEDAVGLVLGDPLHFIRCSIAAKYDQLLTVILERRGVKNTEPVSPSVAIPLLRAAYDESRPELQQLWAELIAAAMDPNRSSQFRISFIETVKQFDPLDALVLRERCNQGELGQNARDLIIRKLGRSQEDIELSIDNLVRLKCLSYGAGNPHLGFRTTAYGRALVRACSS